MKDAKYIPALSYDALTPLYDAVVRLTVREKKFKKALIKQAYFEETLYFNSLFGTLRLLKTKK